MKNNPQKESLQKLAEQYLKFDYQKEYNQSKGLYEQFTLECFNKTWPNVEVKMCEIYFEDLRILDWNHSSVSTKGKEMMVVMSELKEISVDPDYDANELELFNEENKEI